MQVMGPKGTRVHKIIGWTWVGLVLVAVVTSLFMHRKVQGVPELFGFSPVHLFSLMALIGLPLGIRAARRKDVLRHRAIMVAVFAGALLVAGMFAIAPGRILNSVLMGKTETAALSAPALPTPKTGSGSTGSGHP